MTPSMNVPAAPVHEVSRASETAASIRTTPFDRHFWMMLVLSALVVVPRSALIYTAHNESIDDNYHLFRGVAYWRHQLEGVGLNDPPLAEALSALPIVLAGGGVPKDQHMLYGQPVKPHTLLVLIALWKSLLFLPLVAVAFCWLRRVYALRAAWMGAALLTLEPNFAAFIPNASIDVLGVEGIVIGTFFAWRYFEKHGMRRLVAMCVGTAAAMLMKHTSALLPVVIGCFAVLWWVVRPLMARGPRAEVWWRVRLGLSHSLIGTGIFLLAIWGLLLFSVTRPALPRNRSAVSPFEKRLARHELPAGAYIGSLITAREHGGRGHSAYLWGERRSRGWWYYFPAVATYKVPIGVGVIVAMGALSIVVLRPRWDEWPLFIGFVGWTGFVMAAGINIGFRHFLPAYAFLLLLSTRSMAVPGRLGRVVTVIACLSVLATAVHVWAWHPNYISYLNYPREKAYLDITDSNIDWGQSLRQARRWLDEHPEHAGRPVYLEYFGRPEEPHIEYYLAGRITNLATQPELPVPRSGLLILSPVRLVGMYGPRDRYRALRDVKPMDVIGQNLLVYDLDQLTAANILPPLKPPPPRRRPAPPPAGPGH